MTKPARDGRVKTDEILQGHRRRLGSRAEYKLTPIRRCVYLAQLRAGMRRGKAAEAVGITAQGVRDYLRRHPEFRGEIEEAELAASERIEHALYQAALAGNVQAMRLWLVNRMPEQWRERCQTEVKSVVRSQVVLEWRSTASPIVREEQFEE